MNGPARDRVIEATVEEIVHRSDDGQFVVARMSDPEDELFTAIGNLGAIAPGETLRLLGRSTTHPTHGPRFSVTSFLPVLPSTEAGIAKFLGSGLIPGTGKSLAQKIVAQFGTRTLDVIATQSVRLREVPGIGAQRASSIGDAVKARREEAELRSYLAAVGLGPALSKRILQEYGEASARVLRDDPYLVAESIAGIGFRMADRIAHAGGIARDDPRRAAGAVLHLVGVAADEGHTFLDLGTLEARAEELDVPAPLLPAAVDSLVSRGSLLREDDALYAPPLYQAEVDLARLLARHATTRNVPLRVADLIEAQQRSLGLSTMQSRAVEESFRTGLFVLTGGPGTGKTTTTRAIVEAHESLGQRVLLLAPTGRAAKRLSEATGRQARTIHRTLEWNPRTGRPTRDEFTPFDVELVLIDEASMLDIVLARLLLRAIAPATKVVLVGDIDQLPPVSAGPVLREVLLSNRARVVRLDTVFRQAEESAIVRGAHAILAGRLPEVSAPESGGTGELHLIRASDPDRVRDVLVRSLERLRARYGLDPIRDVQVLTPTRRGPLGAEQLNLWLQSRLNPDGARGPASIAFRAGDKVMQLKNDYERDVYNGDLGEISRIVGGEVFVVIDGREVRYALEDLDTLSLAYATTIHKAQGSEFPCVVLVLHGSHALLLNRPLFYTALTRAKKAAVLLGDPKAMLRAVRNTGVSETRCRLHSRLAQASG